MHGKEVPLNTTAKPISMRGLPPAVKRIMAFTAAVCVLSVVFVLLLLLPKIKEGTRLTAELVAATADFNEAHDRIAKLATHRATTTQIENKLKKLGQSGVLEPLLGSLEMRGMSLVSPIADRTGVTLVGDDVRCLPQLPIKSPETIKGRVYARQPIQFTGRGSYAQIVAFVKEIETTMPLVSVSSLRILAQPNAPEVHMMALSLEWPVVVEKKPVVEGQPK